jgi:hypothetical protein
MVENGASATNLEGRLGEVHTKAGSRPAHRVTESEAKRVFARGEYAYANERPRQNDQEKHDDVLDDPKWEQDNCADFLVGRTVVTRHEMSSRKVLGGKTDCLKCHRVYIIT